MEPFEREIRVVLHRFRYGAEHQDEFHGLGGVKVSAVAFVDARNGTSTLGELLDQAEVKGVAKEPSLLCFHSADDHQHEGGKADQ